MCQVIIYLWRFPALKCLKINLFRSNNVPNPKRQQAMNSRDQCEHRKKGRPLD